MRILGSGTDQISVQDCDSPIEIPFSGTSENKVRVGTYSKNIVVAMLYTANPPEGQSGWSIRVIRSVGGGFDYNISVNAGNPIVLIDCPSYTPVLLIDPIPGDIAQAWASLKSTLASHQITVQEAIDLALESESS